MYARETETTRTTDPNSFGVDSYLRRHVEIRRKKERKMQHNTFECALFNVRWRVFFFFFYFIFRYVQTRRAGVSSCADEFKRPPCTVIIMGEAKYISKRGWTVEREKAAHNRPAAAANSCWVRRNLARLFGPLLMSRRERKTCGVH